ncbi:MAG: DUF4417 domain-containing protein [Clostridia bacterium]|nr:DUF4417 domain-containing protein [Clostridia bacterium]
MKSVEYRNNPMFLRNQFLSEGTFEMPKISCQDVSLEKIEFIGYDKLSASKENQIVHFFLDDYKFEVMWNDPLPRVERLIKCKAVLSPNFSVYTEMPIALKIFNTFRSRWCGAFLQSCGIKVIPTLAWGGPETFWFCFDGIEQGSVVAVSTVGVRTEKDLFMQGYNEMIRRIKPSKILCYGQAFSEMKGNVIEVDYAQTNNYIKCNSGKGVYVKRVTGYACTYHQKGMGSANKGIPKFPGWDPTVPPGEKYEWRGKGSPESGRGSWVRSDTREVLHPDLNHKGDIGPHWDYTCPGSGSGFRLFADGSVTPKFYEGDIVYA